MSSHSVESGADAARFKLSGRTERIPRKGSSRIWLRARLQGQPGGGPIGAWAQKGKGAVESRESRSVLIAKVALAAVEAPVWLSMRHGPASARSMPPRLRVHWRKGCMWSCACRKPRPSRLPAPLWLALAPQHIIPCPPAASGRSSCKRPPPRNQARCGPSRMTAAPARQSRAPLTSQRSGITPSTIQSQSRAEMM